MSSVVNKKYWLCWVVYFNNSGSSLNADFLVIFILILLSEGQDLAKNYGKYFKPIYFWF